VLQRHRRRGFVLRRRRGTPRAQYLAVEARVAHDAKAGVEMVHQTWNDLTFSLRDDRQLAGRRCFVCVSPLNSYLVIQAAPGERAAAFSVAELTQIGEQFDFAREPLLARIAVIDGPPVNGAAAEPFAKFVTCGEREHPSAPLTGLAVLAIVAQRLDWRYLRQAAHLRTHAGLMSLPRVDVYTNETARVEFAGLIVSLDLESAPVL